NNSQVLSCINGLSLENPRLVKDFRYTNPVFYQTLSFFLVFQNDEIALVIICLLAILSVNFVASRVVAKHPISRLILSFSRFVLFPLCFTFLFFIYSAAFRGNLVIPFVSPIVTFSNMIENLSLGKWSLLTTIGMTDEENQALADATNGAAAEVVESSTSIFERACASDKTIIRIFDIEKERMLSMDSCCAMQKIPATKGPEEALRMQLKQNSDTLPYFLLFSRKLTNTRTVEYVNYALRMFSEDQMDRFWNKRFMREAGTLSKEALSRYYSGPQPLSKYDPITALIIALIIFIIELLYHRFQLHKTVKIAIGKSQNKQGQWIIPHDRLSKVFDNSIDNLPL
ncbi:hypothetical protein PFISCL1PPCAC_25364, partial [Pristionchus fissidentatus]